MGIGVGRGFSICHNGSWKRGKRWAEREWLKWGVEWLHVEKDRKRTRDEKEIAFSSCVAFLCVSDRYQANSTCWFLFQPKSPDSLSLPPCQAEAVMRHSEQMETSGLTKVVFGACYYHDNSPQPPASILMKAKCPLPPALPRSVHSIKLICATFMPSKKWSS